MLAVDLYVRDIVLEDGRDVHLRNARQSVRRRVADMGRSTEGNDCRGILTSGKVPLEKTISKHVYKEWSASRM